MIQVGIHINKIYRSFVHNSSFYCLLRPQIVYINTAIRETPSDYKMVLFILTVQTNLADRLSMSFHHSYRLIPVDIPKSQATFPVAGDYK